MRGFDFSQLDGEDVIGVNDSIFIEHGNMVAGIYKDNVFQDSCMEALLKRAKEVPIHTFPANARVSPHFVIHKHADEWTHKVRQSDSLPFYRSSGNCAIGLAAKLGYKRIFLLGFDCHMVDGKTHWHDPHSRQTLGSYRAFMQAAEKLKDDMDEVFPGVEVINLHPDDQRPSSIPVWPRVPFLERNTKEKPVKNNVVIWVYKTGGVYDGHAERLITAQREGILKHLPGQPDNLVFKVLTDAPMQIEGVETVPLKRAYEGWFSKFELFREDIAEYDDRIVYFDLDTKIQGDISQLFEVPTSRFYMLADFYQPHRFASGVMVFGAGRHYYALAAYDSKLHQISYHSGDQPFISKWVSSSGYGPFSLQNDIPDTFYSYKQSCQGRGPVQFVPKELKEPEDCPVLCFHGNPRPWSL